MTKSGDVLFIVVRRKTIVYHPIRTRWYERSISIVFGAQVFCHPNLVADFYCIVSIAIIIRNCIRNYYCCGRIIWIVGSRVFARILSVVLTSSQENL